MQDAQYKADMNTTSNLKIIISKIPFKLRDKFRSIACDIMEQDGQRASFKDLVNFIEKQARIVLDPIFGDIQDPRAGNKVSKMITTASKLANRSSSSFATAITVSENPGSEIISNQLRQQA